MKYLFIAACLLLSLAANAYVRKTCSCYGGWNCSPNSGGGTYCTNNAYSWYQDASKPCSNANAYTGSVTTAVYDSYSPAPGAPYSSVEMISLSYGGNGNDVLCGN